MSPPYNFYDSWVMGIIIIFIINIPINLFWYMTILSVLLRRWGPDICTFPKETGIFLGKLILLSMIITFLGAIIDLLFLYEKSSGYFVLAFDAVKWAIATVLIFGSLFVISNLFLKMKYGINVLLSGTIALLNPFFWFLILQYKDSPVCWTLLITMVLTPLPLIYLIKWHWSDRKFVE